MNQKVLLKVLQRVLPDAHPKVVSNGCEALQARGGPAPGALTLPPARAPRRCCSAAAPGCHGVCSCARKPRMRAGVCSGKGFCGLAGKARLGSVARTAVACLAASALRRAGPCACRSWTRPRTIWCSWTSTCRSAPASGAAWKCHNQADEPVCVSGTLEAWPHAALLFCRSTIASPGASGMPGGR